MCNDQDARDKIDVDDNDDEGDDAEQWEINQYKQLSNDKITNAIR